MALHELQVRVIAPLGPAEVELDQSRVVGAWAGIPGPEFLIPATYLMVTWTKKKFVILGVSLVI